MIGQTISHYRVLETLGGGGMGVVYRAHDELLKRDVALKLLREGVAGQNERRARILTEARAASALNHPNIVTVYEVGEFEGQLFIVMELVEGETLRQRLGSSGPLESIMLARIATQIAEALEGAHSRGIVHGDIKPENIVQQPNGRVKLFDFGIARQVGEETVTQTRLTEVLEETHKSSMAGTLAYMAPEILRGDPSDARSDLFSLGVTLFELAAGRLPFPGPTLNLLVAQILHEPAPRLGPAQHAVPQEFARIVHKLLEKDPTSRYQTARELHVDLTNLVRDLELGTVLPAALVGKRALAVLPFKMLTPNPEDEYLGVALADAVINHLGGSGELLVRPTNTVRRYAKESVDPLLVARELNVQVVVDGSIQKSGTRLRVHVQAWNSADGTTLLTSKYDSEMAAIFDLQDKLAEALARALGLQSPSEVKPPEPPTKNPRAYELYLRAVERLSCVNRWDTRTAIEMLENATQLAPDFNQAWARLAEACVFMAGTFDPRPIWYKKAEQALRRALAGNPSDSHALCARGRVLWTPLKGYKNREALRALAESLRRSPGYHSALVWRSLILLHCGVHEEAVEGLHAALAAHPDDGFALTFLGQVMLFESKYDEAERYFNRALSLDPSSLWANLFSPMVPLYGPNPESAVGVLSTAQQIVPGDALLISWEALLWAKRGVERTAERLVQKALRIGKSVLHTHHMWHTAAATYATIGKRAEAVRLLARAGRTGLPNYPLFRDDPHFKPLAGYAPFLRLLGTLKKETDAYRREFGKSSPMATS